MLADTLKEEPLLISFLVRMACQQYGVAGLERVLNRVPTPDSELSDLAGMLATAENPEVLDRTLVGERCMGLHYFGLSIGDLESFLESLETVPGSDSEHNGDLLNRAWSKIGIWLFEATGQMERDDLFYLKCFEDLLAAAKTPPHLRVAAGSLVGTRVGASKREKFPYILSGLIVPGVIKVFPKDARNVASIRLAQTALAIERFRLKNGGMPTDLTALVPSFLEQPPLDPFDGKLLRFRKLEKGYTLYSVGPDATDDHGRQSKPDDKAHSRWDLTFTVTR